MTAIGTLPVVLGTGDHASRPAASAVGAGGLYSCTDHSLVYQTDGSSWSTWATLGTSGAYTAGGTDVALADGGTGASLVDPNADRLLFWDDSAGSVAFLTAGTGLSISTTTMTASGTPLSSDVATVTTNETLTGNNSFVDLSTSGPAVTITVNTKCLVTVGAEVSWTGSSAANRYAAMGFVLSSGNTLAASRQRSYIVVGEANGVGGGGGASRAFILTGLTPGSTVFTAKYNQLGTGATANWQYRELSVLCLD